MNGLDKIREKVMLDTDLQVNRIIDDAKSQIEKINYEVSKRIAETENAYNSENKIFLQQDNRRFNSEVSMEKRRIELEAKNRLIEECQSQTKYKLMHLEKDKKVDFYLSLINSYAQDDDKIQISKNDESIAGKLKESLANNISLYETFADFSGGIRILREKVNIDLTFEEILKQVVDKEITNLANILYK